MYQQGNYPGIDPNFNRVIEDTLNIVNDVDQRLQSLRVGLAQAVPHLAPAILGRQGTPFTGNIGTPGLMAPTANPFGQVPTMGIPPQMGFAPHLAHGAPLGATPFGFGAPLTGFGAPTMGVGQVPYAQQGWGVNPQVGQTWSGIPPQPTGPGVVGSSFRPY
jgi:hypothetical protein